MIKLPVDRSAMRFMAPLSDLRAAELVRFIAQTTPETILDVGCGWATLLLDVLTASNCSTGVGIDLDEAAIHQARENAAARGLTTRVSLIAGDVLAQLPPHVDAAICIGSGQVWGSPVELAQPIDYRSALNALRALLSSGGTLVYGEGVWTSPPTPAAIAPLAGRNDEFVTLPELLSIASECGFAVVRAHQASQDEWDQFESFYSAPYAQWLASHPSDHPDAAAVAERLGAQQDAYFNGYRGILGMAYLELLAV